MSPLRVRSCVCSSRYGCSLQSASKVADTFGGADHCRSCRSYMCIRRGGVVSSSSKSSHLSSSSSLLGRGASCFMLTRPLVRSAVTRTTQYRRISFAQCKHYVVNRGCKHSNDKLRWLAAGTIVLSGSYCVWWSRGEDDYSTLPISKTRFSPTILVSSEKTSETTKWIQLQAPPSVAASLRDLPAIWSVYIKDSDIQVERPYTPLEGISEDGSLSFWIRKYSHGEVGRWMHSKIVGDRIEIRGPERTWTWREGEYDDIVMVRFSSPFESYLTYYSLQGEQGLRLFVSSFIHAFQGYLRKNQLSSP